MKVSVLGAAVVVELTDDALAECCEAWLFGLAKDLPGRQIHLDCEGVTSISSQALATLIGLQKKVKDGGGQLRLFNLSPDVYEVIVASRLEKLLDAQVRTEE